MTIPGKYIADNIAVDIVNNPGYFEVIDRHHLDQIMKEAKLNSEGYIDETTAKKLGKILAVDAIITGTYTVLSDKIKLTIIVLDAETAKDIASAKTYLPLDNDACALLGINCSTANSNSSQRATNNIGSRGFNAPVQSGEDYNNPETVNNNCKTQNFGDYCFENQKGVQVIIYYKPKDYNCKTCTSGELHIEAGKMQCLYQLGTGAYHMDIRYPPSPSASRYSWGTAPDIEGDFLVEQCKSKTYTLH